MTKVVTPVKVEKFISMLRSVDYDSKEIQFLENGFTSGFDIGYEGPQERQSTSENIPFTMGNDTILWNKIMKEVSLDRVAGSFEKIPFSNFIQSPVGLVPKAGNQTRLIFHLSYDFKDGLKSLNHFTPHTKCTVKYKDLGYAVSMYLDLSFELFREDERSRTDSHSTRDELKKKWC